MNQRIKKLKELAGGSEIEKIDLLVEASKKAGDLYKENPTTANNKALKAADRALDQYTNDLEIKYLHDKPPFKNLAAIVRYFKNQDFEIKKTKIYDDAKTGKLKIRKDGKINFSAVEDYIINEQLKKKGDYAESGENLSRSKKFFETELIKERLAQQKLDREIKLGQYVSADRVEMEQAIKARVFKAGFRHMFEVFMREFLIMVGGDLNQTKQSVDFWIKKADNLFNDFARLEDITVKIKQKNLKK